jgi:hypothetical protein
MIVSIVVTAVSASIGTAAAQQDMTAEQKIAHAKRLCEGNHVFKIQYKCDCIVEHFALELSKSPARGTANVLHDTTNKHGKKCVNTAAIHADALTRCADEFRIVADDAMTKLGMPQYCHCMADKTVTVGKMNAILQCKKVTKYQVPSDSPLIIPAEDAAGLGAEPQGCPGVIGGVCKDGTIFAGLSPDGNKKMYTMPADAPGEYQLGDYDTLKALVPCDIDSPTGGTCESGRANTKILGDDRYGRTSPAFYCGTLKAHGHEDWYLPAINELHVLYKNLGPAPKNGFQNRYYWSSSTHVHHAWVESFIYNSTEAASYKPLADRYVDQHRELRYPGAPLNVRCVRRVGN